MTVEEIRAEILDLFVEKIREAAKSGELEVKLYAPLKEVVFTLKCADEASAKIFAAV